MSFVRQIKESLGLAEPPKTFECQDYGITFESHVDEDSAWLSCSECDSDNVEKISE